MCAEYFLNDSQTCMASSLVGVSMSACGSLILILILSNMGRAKAAVFPVPVCACPTTSLPDIRTGITPDCIGVGSM
ncbi:MAG: hypothetical protein BWY02_02937 [bacterium ADurb.Bin157]|nr:MAG: hypothetical protein BWY02_02937 [bacterium ADurb.Bin157]